MNIITKILIGIALLLLTLLVYGEYQYKRWLRYHWSIAVSAPERYLMIDLDSYFSQYNGNHFSMLHFNHHRESHKVIHTGWGERSFYSDASTYGFLPQTFSMAWYSLVEDRFYRAAFTIPQDTLDVLLEQWEDKLSSPDKEEDITFIVGVAPCGTVVLWVNRWGQQAELARYRAEISSPDWNKVVDGVQADKDSFLNIVVREFIEKQYTSLASRQATSCEVWQQAQKPYRWIGLYKASVEYPVKEVVSHFFTREGQRIYPYKEQAWTAHEEIPAIKPEAYSSQGLPYVLSVSWISPGEQKIYRGTVSLPTDTIEALLENGAVTSSVSGAQGSGVLFVAELATGGCLQLWFIRDGRQHKIGEYQIAESAVSYQHYLEEEEARIQKEKEKEEKDEHDRNNPQEYIYREIGMLVE